MQKKFFPLLLLPIFALASCGSPSTPAATPAANTPAAANTAVSSKTANTAPSRAANTQDTGDQSKSPEEQQIFTELNAARAVARNCGGKAMPAAAPVTWNGYLAAAARGHALDMANRSFFAHVNPDGLSIKERAEAAGYKNWKELGENIAAGYGISTVTAGWLNSPSHCETLMDPALKEVGIAYIYRPGTQYGTYWVQDFGTR